MRRISLALALLGAVTAAGCGGGSTPDQGGARGVPEGTFTITIQNGQDGNASLAITGGYVTSSPAGIDCGVAPHSACSAAFPLGSTVTLTATASVTGKSFLGWAGDCYVAGNVCTISNESADQYVLAQFGAVGDVAAHPNWDPMGPTPREHATQTQTLLATVPFASPWQCAACHGGGLQGAGLAPRCAGCHSAGSATVIADGATKPAGETCVDCHDGQGAVHQAQYSKYADAPTLVATIESVVSTPNPAPATTFKSVVTFNLKKNGVAYGDATLSGLAQKRYMGQKYDPTTKKFETASAISYGTLKSLGSGRYTVEAAAAKFAPESSDAFVYFYFAEPSTIVKPAGHYALYENVASVAVPFGTLDFVSAANSSDCEKCHGAPYQKHGYRAGAVAGIPDMVACKACHHDQRVGTHADWQCLAEDPAAYAAGKCAELPQWASFAYVANTMNDTHMSHAMEFAYPQSMANCTTCHSGKLTQILTDAKFTLTTCKSCHPITAALPDAHRAPPLNPAGVAPAVLPAYHGIDRATGKIAAGLECNECHADDVETVTSDPVTHVYTVTYYPAGDPAATDGAGPLLFGHTEPVPLFKDIHSGYNHAIYDASGAKYSSSITSSVTSAAFDSGTNTLTIDFSVSGADANAIIKPTVVISLYGYDTKDFIVGGHGSAADGKRNLEWAEGASGNSPRLTVTPNATAGNTTWTATADLTLWAAMLADGSVKKAEIGFLPYIGIDQAAAPSATTNPYIAIAGVTKTFDLVGNAVLADNAVYGKAIVDTGKCNACHEALATTFHSPAYGSAGVVGCRLCHIVGNGGSHLPMQSRSIDSYVHAIHSMQPFDPGDIDFGDPVEKLHYDHHLASTYPNFTTLNCESCHNPGTYNIPNQALSLPGILSANDPGMPFSVPSVVTGPGARACGGCHRAALINAGDASALGQFDIHTKEFGYREADPDGAGPTTTTTILNDIIQRLLP